MQNIWSSRVAMTSQLLTTLSSACRGILKPHFIPTIMLVILSLVVIPYSFYVTSQKRHLLINKITTNNSGLRGHAMTTYKVLSAFYEEAHPTKRIRVLGFHHMTESLPVYCKLLSPDGITYCLANPASKDMIIDYRRKYSSDREVIVTCSYKFDAEIIGVSLSFSSHCDDVGPIIHVEYPMKSESKPASEVHLCLLGYPRLEFSNNIIKVLQLWRHYGIDAMDLYTNPIQDEEIRKLLKSLEKTSRLRHHIWAPGDRALHKYGYTLAMNDCFYRYRHSSKYIMFADAFYFLFLQNSTTFSELFEEEAKNITSPFIIDSYALEDFNIFNHCQNTSALQTTLLPVTTWRTKGLANIVYPSKTEPPIALKDEVIWNENNIRIASERAMFMKLTSWYEQVENKTMVLQGKQLQRLCQYSAMSHMTKT